MSEEQSVSKLRTLQTTRVFWILAFLIGLHSTTFAQSDSIVAIDFNADSTYLAVGYASGRVTVQDVFTDEVVFDYGPLDLGINTIAWSPVNPNEIAFSGGTAVITIIDLSNFPITPRFTPPVDDVDSIAWSPDGRQLAVSARVGFPTSRVAIQVFDVRTMQIVSSIETQTDFVNAIEWNPTELTIAVGSIDGSVLLINPDTGEITQTIDATDALVYDLSWSIDGMKLAVASSSNYPPDTTIQIWEIDSNRQSLKLVFNSLVDIEYRPFSETFAIVGDGRLQVIDSQTGATIFEILASDTVSPLSWSVSGDRVAYVDQTNNIRYAQIPPDTH